jgi:4-hydroxy-tetrahydrodipicolinate synthase
MTTPFTLSGVYTAIVTPFSGDEAQSVDLPSLDRLVDGQLAAGVAGLVPCGTTGECPTLSADEQVRVVRQVVKRAAGRATVLAGTGTNSTLGTIEASLRAIEAGADGVMVVVPYYNKPTQEGLVRHFVAVARAVPRPIIIYNIPGRTGIDLLPDAVGRILGEAPNVVGMKEATGNVLRATELVRRFGERLAVLCGDDSLTLPMMAVGARGVISVTSNLLPGDIVRLVRLVADGRAAEARALHLSLLPVHEAMFVEANPSPVKAAMSMAGLLGDAVRLPLAPASAAARTTIQAALEAYRRAGA